MRGLRETGRLSAFSERMLGARVHSLGRVGIALAACEMLENGREVTHDVSAFLLVREEEGWRIAAQAWDVVR